MKCVIILAALLIVGCGEDELMGEDELTLEEWRELKPFRSPVIAMCFDEPRIDSCGFPVIRSRYRCAPSAEKREWKLWRDTMVYSQTPRSLTAMVGSTDPVEQEIFHRWLNRQWLGYKSRPEWPRMDSIYHQHLHADTTCLKLSECVK